VFGEVFPPPEPWHTSPTFVGAVPVPFKRPKTTPKTQQNQQKGMYKISFDEILVRFNGICHGKREATPKKHTSINHQNRLLHSWTSVVEAFGSRCVLRASHNIAGLMLLMVHKSGEPPGM